MFRCFYCKDPCCSFYRHWLYLDECYSGPGGWFACFFCLIGERLGMNRALAPRRFGRPTSGSCAWRGTSTAWTRRWPGAARRARSCGRCCRRAEISERGAELPFADFYIFSVLVSTGIDRYWTYFYFSRGLKQMEGTDRPIRQKTGFLT